MSLNADLKFQHIIDNIGTRIHKHMFVFAMEYWIIC